MRHSGDFGLEVPTLSPLPCRSSSVAPAGGLSSNPHLLTFFGRWAMFLLLMLLPGWGGRRCRCPPPSAVSTVHHSARPRVEAPQMPVIQAALPTEKALVASVNLIVLVDHNLLKSIAQAGAWAFAAAGSADGSGVHAMPTQRQKGSVHPKTITAENHSKGRETQI